MERKIIWTPSGLVCLKCGGPNSDGGSVCGSCEEFPFSPREGLLTKEQIEERRAILEGVKRN